MSKENKYDSDTEKKLIKILKSYEQKASQLDVQEKERIINARQFSNVARHFVKWLQSRGDVEDDRLPEETPFCPYCGHKKGYKVTTDINSGKECKNPFCKKQ